MAVLNSNGQQVIGWLSPAPSSGSTGSTVNLNASIYAVWNGDITSTVTTLNTNAYAAWNGENNTNDSVGS